ncbi:MAG: hypothetical protein Q8N23_18595 [Archangium sp.]|nr:hypothetical protein [Archangium sp.]MDP3154695.1 hypothetical protein [Archangium sp.]MDP3573585.1 hypothetical protein [Archangium sp.]
MTMAKTREQKLYGAAVLKVSFLLRDASDSPAFKLVYPGVLRDLGLEDKEVDEFIAANREAVEKSARGEPG